MAFTHVEPLTTIECSTTILESFGNQLLVYGNNSSKLIRGWTSETIVDTQAAEVVLEEACAILEIDPAVGSLCDRWIGSLVVIIYDYWETSTSEGDRSFRYHESYEKATYALLCMLTTTKMAKQTLATTISLRLLGELTRVLGEILMDDISYTTQESTVEIICRTLAVLADEVAKASKRRPKAAATAAALLSGVAPSDDRNKENSNAATSLGRGKSTNNSSGKQHQIKKIGEAERGEEKSVRRSPPAVQGLEEVFQREMDKKKRKKRSREDEPLEPHPFLSDAKAAAAAATVFTESKTTITEDTLRRQEGTLQRILRKLPPLIREILSHDVASTAASVLRNPHLLLNRVNAINPWVDSFPLQAVSLQGLCVISEIQIHSDDAYDNANAAVDVKSRSAINSKAVAAVGAGGGDASRSSANASSLEGISGTSTSVGTANTVTRGRGRGGGEVVVGAAGGSVREQHQRLVAQSAYFDVTTAGTTISNHTDTVVLNLGASTTTAGGIKQDEGGGSVRKQGKQKVPQKLHPLQHQHQQHQGLWLDISKHHMSFRLPFVKYRYSDPSSMVVVPEDPSLLKFIDEDEGADTKVPEPVAASDHTAAAKKMKEVEESGVWEMKEVEESGVWEMKDCVVKMEYTDIRSIHFATGNNVMQIDLGEISDSMLEDLLHPRELELFRQGNALVFRLEFGADGAETMHGAEKLILQRLKETESTVLGSIYEARAKNK